MPPTKLTVKMNPRVVTQKARAASIVNLGHAGGAIRMTAQRSIVISPNYAPVGHAPHSRHGALKHAIQYAVDQTLGNVVIGPEFAGVGPSGRPHELGERFRGRNYPSRPYMMPALRRIQPRLERFWVDSVT